MEKEPLVVPAEGAEPMRGDPYACGLLLGIGSTTVAIREVVGILKSPLRGIALNGKGTRKNVGTPDALVVLRASDQTLVQGEGFY